MNLSPTERIASYARAFPKFPAPYLAGDRIEGLWIMGACFKTSGYYGAYPHGYLNRVYALFPGVEKLCHLFSGSLPPGPYSRIDLPGKIEQIQPWDRECDAHKISDYVEPNTFDLILADPPYSQEDAEHYGAPMVSRKKVLQECWKVLRPGGWVIWLDQVLPQFRKDQWFWGLAVGMFKSTNHRVRGVFGFQKI